ncbi:uncharacterized protein Dana_GF25271 [Drosophila ananassae]|uniref:C2H2-type domain-containing protein n=1 Tax=Drosophila ananassae TaxID=7217 RepID=B3M478_DROAN|nr:uncharacterized protein LOC6507895 isoform X2 [Drosophila ananassae]XP_044570995.1 uncharacterized protein LOC6507895 isoform X2 [Drosophila ananassae]EDV39348.1 uncharacterized protein Dana_GF25271 [Drosophila ananassae]
MESGSSGITDMEITTDAGQPTQITSIDGFFNRKRGRPPKNRFVEVYKSAQHSPQAIFTSFKLERSDPGTPVSGSSLVDSLDDRFQSPETEIDLTPSRNRKRNRLWGRSSSAVEQSPGRRSSFSVAHLATNVPQNSRQENTSQAIDTATSKSDSSKVLDRISVVRAAGTFYPENANSSSQTDNPEVARSSRFISRQESGDLEVDQPEDLSMRPSLPEPTATAAVDVEPALNMNLLQFKQLIDLYQRQVLLPSFLAAASQPLALPGSGSGAGADMRLLLEIAAHQKLLHLNAAVAATASANATATATATTVSATADSSGQRVPGRRIRDHDIPSGYLKFRFNEDCGFEKCGYRNHQSHFHCNRRDCHYSFCDKTRFVQHTARHDRMDTLMGDDFRQFRANMQCGVASCSYAASTGRSSDSDPLDSVASTSKKTSHFHCRKCDYVCTDSNKVVAHRRLHLRQDYVRSAGFRKVNGNEPCNSTSCTYALRHTHYHCVTCDGGVLSRAQLSGHKHRTSLPKQEAETTP